MRRSVSRHVGSGRRVVRNGRGVTFLETILASVLIGMVAVTLASVVGYARVNLERQRMRLAMAEVAHSLVLQYVDDPVAFKGIDPKIGYDEYVFRFEVSEELPVEVIESDAAREIASEQTGSAPIQLGNQLKLVSVTVWVAEESGGSSVLTADVHSIQMARIINLIAFKNPDSGTRQLASEDGMRRLLDTMTSAMGATVANPEDGESGRGGGRAGNRDGNRGGGNGGRGRSRDGSDPGDGGPFRRGGGGR